ncbi:MAG: APC family permease [Gemmatimonadota bacterium]
MALPDVAAAADVLSDANATPRDPSTTGSLKRVLGPVGVSLLTLSVLTPGASVLVTGVDVVHHAGTGAALAFLLGGLLTLVFTTSQAELGAAFPLAGGDYAIVGNALGPRAGFVLFGLVLFATPVFLALSAVGVSLYVRTLWSGMSAPGIAIGAIALSSGIAILNIRTGAKLTGTFLFIELGALALLTVLGLAHPVQPLAAMVTSPLALVSGALATPTIAAMVLAIVAASYATAGAGQAIYFSEEMHDPRSVGRLVMLIALLTLCLEFLPVLGVVIGAGNLPGVLAAESPFTAFIAERGSSLIATLVTLGIIAALFNAIVSGLTCYARFLYSTGRDRIWAGGINHALTRLHPRFGSPWIATLVLAVFAAGCCILPLNSIVPLVSFATLANWVFLSVACIVGRRSGATGKVGGYRSPLFPLPQVLTLLAVAGLTVLVWNDRINGRPGVITVIVVIALSMLYHRFILERRAGGWSLITNAS